MRTRAFGLVVAAFFAVCGATAAEAADRIFYVRSTQAGCDALSLPDPADCSTLIGTALTGIWAEQTAHPTSTFLVDIGPGNFSFPYVVLIHDVTFRGSGTRTTVATMTYFGPSVDDLHFQDMSVVGNGVDYRAGSSTWTNVAISGSRYGFQGKCTSGPTDVTHRFFSSTVETRAENASHNAAIYARCGAVTLHGTDVRAVGNALSSPTATTVVGIEATGIAVVELYGSSVRVPALAPFDPAFNVQVTGAHEPASGQPEGLFGIRVGAFVSGGAAAGGGTVRMHGGIVNVNGQDIDHPVGATAVLGVAGAAADLSDTAFFTRAGGTAYRLRNTAAVNVRSPFLWEPSHGDVPHGEPRSVDGADMYVDTGCLCSGLCDGSGTETHLMVYNSSCTEDGWFDTTTRRCRSDVDNACLE